MGDELSKTKGGVMTINGMNVKQTVKDVECKLNHTTTTPSQLRSMILILLVFLKFLLDKISVNSTNSSVPPSKDSKRKRGSRIKGKSIRKPGGQPGHRGKTLTRIENPDKVESLTVDRSKLPVGDYKKVGYQSRQVIDIQINRHVTEYQAEVLEDAEGRQFIAPFPEGVTKSVQYGNSVKAQAVYLTQYQLIPFERTKDYFAHLCQIPISTGTICNFVKYAYQRLEYFEPVAKKALLREKVLHTDETGANVNGKIIWIHGISSDKWTLLYPHSKRGFEAVTDFDVLTRYTGHLCHDHWKSYFKLKNCSHVLCNAHHLRELTRAWEQDEQCWAKKVHKLLLDANKETKENDGVLSLKRAKSLSNRYRSLLEAGRIECEIELDETERNQPGPSPKTKSRNLLERLLSFKEETLAFTTDSDIPFTNNQIERDFRMYKVQQKISGCFRSFEGAKMSCLITSYISTCMKNGIGAARALQALFNNEIPDFIIQADNSS